MRYPPNDTSLVTREEARELYISARAPVIAYHHLPQLGKAPNALLYLCRDPDYDISKLSANNRSKVRRALKRLVIRRATPDEIAATGYESYADTHARNGLSFISRTAFEAKWRGSSERDNRELWAAFANDRIAALGILRVCGRWAELESTSSANAHLRDYPNHGLFYSVLYDLMHRIEIESVSYGLSSVQARGRHDSLHHFKRSVNLEALPVTRQIKANPVLRPAVNSVTRAALRMLERRFPQSVLIRTAQGALELMEAGEPVTLGER